MKKSLLFFVIYFVMLTTCEKNQEIISPESPVKPSSEELSQLVDITMAGYESMMITNRSGTRLDSKLFSRIELGEKDLDGFYTREQVTPVYRKNQREYEFSFVMPHRILNKSVREYFFSLRFFLERDGYVDLDTLILTYKYPYSSTQMFIDNLKAFHEYQYLSQVQDFVLIGRKFYSYCFGWVEVSEYDLDTQKMTILYYFPGGDHIAGNPEYLYLDDEHYRIFRHNFMKDSLDLEIKYPYSQFFPDILGMAVYNDFLYVASFDSNTRQPVLLKYDLDGNLLEYQPVLHSGRYLTINEGLLYTNYDWLNKITRIDLASGAVLSQIPYPAESVDGIQAYDGKLYFTDYNRKLISTIPLAEFDSGRITTSQRITERIPLPSHLNPRDQNEEVLKP